MLSVLTILFSLMKPTPGGGGTNVPGNNPNFVGQTVLAVKNQVASGFQAWETTYRNFTAKTNSAYFPNSTTALSTVTPAYGFQPSAPTGLQWSLGQGMFNSELESWVCLSGTGVDQETQQGLVYAGQVLGSSYTTNSTCGTTQSISAGSSPQNFAATFWLTPPPPPNPSPSSDPAPAQTPGPAPALGLVPTAPTSVQPVPATQPPSGNQLWFPSGNQLWFPFWKTSNSAPAGGPASNQNQSAWQRFWGQW